MQTMKSRGVILRRRSSTRRGRLEGSSRQPVCFRSPPQPRRRLSSRCATQLRRATWKRRGRREV